MSCRPQRTSHFRLDIKVLNYDPSTRAPALAGGYCSGFRPTGVLEGATGLPVGLHIDEDRFPWGP
ncbi:MAG: hypothetical protein U1E51_17620, partial [Candidatus Binatia bacterium]|nr:hypothetical protein [Candidatus Binatia bacterium]